MFFTFYFTVAIVIAIILILQVNLDKNFDKYIHDCSKGQFEFTWYEKITVPLVVGLFWPYTLYLAIRKVIHG